MPIRFERLSQKDPAPLYWKASSGKRIRVVNCANRGNFMVNIPKLSWSLTSEPEITMMVKTFELNISLTRFHQQVKSWPA